MLAVADRLQTLNIHCTGQQLQIWGDILGLTEQMGQPLGEATLAQFFELAQNHLYQAAARSPILIVIEDLHLADQFSLDLLDQIAQKLRKRRLLILVTYRPQPDFSFRTLHRSICTAIVLEDLAPERARAVVKQIVGTDDLPVIVQQRLGMRDRNGRSSPVNPLFLVESLKLMMAQGILNMAENGRIHLNTGQLEQLQVPDNVYAISLTQLDHLSASSRSLLQAASVIGREFDLLTLTAVAPSADAAVIQQHLAELQASGMIQLVAEEPQPTYMFQRALMHNAVYQSLPFARRQLLHALIADGLIARHRNNLPPIYPILAYHYGQSDRHEDGLRYAVLAAKEAENLHANKEAAELYELAQRHILVLGEANYWQQAIYVYNNRARVLHMAGQFKQAIIAAADALKLALVHGSPADSQPIYNMLAEIRYGQARYTDVQALTTNVTKNPVGCEPRVLIRAYTLAGLAANGLFDYEAANAALMQAHEIALAAANAYELVYVLGTQALLHYEHGRLDAAHETGQEAVRLARQENVPVPLALSLSALCQIQVRRGKPEEALTAINEAIHLIQPLSRNLWARFLVQRTAVSLYLGRLPAAYTDLQDATRLLQEMEDPHSLLQVYLLWLELHQTRDDWPEARKWLAQAGELMAAQKAENAAYTTEQLRLWLATGQMALHFQHPEQAESHFHLAMRAVQARHLSWWRPAVLYWLAMLKVALQNYNRAVHYFEAALKAVKRGGDPDMLPLILLQLALLEEDNGRRAQYLTASVNAANVRARYRDRITCFRTAAPLLTDSADPQLRQIGQRCQKLVAWFDAEVES
jgi:predicted ATPase